MADTGSGVGRVAVKQVDGGVASNAISGFSVHGVLLETVIEDVKKSDENRNSS